jgi:transposase InsO family protein
VHEYALALRERYGVARKNEKGKILDEFCQTTGLHRKAAIRLLRKGVGLAPVPKKKGRPARYGAEVEQALVRVWEAVDRMCGKLLVGVLPELVASLERHGELRLAPKEREALMGMSAATIDRRLRSRRRGLGRQPRRQALATTALKAQIPIRTWSEWQDVRPGSVQADLVLHCGESTEGFFLTTLTVVDVATGWVECQEVWGMGMSRVGGAVQRASMQLPFALRELHTDNGGEFINRALRDWCLRHGIRFTRGRGYRKNDQAYVEQRNWLAVRRLVGYDRYRSQAAFAALRHLYSLLRLQMNFFRPVRKLVGKERRGPKVSKLYDTPRTPYQRLLESGILDGTARQQLEKKFRAINPAALQRSIEQTLRELWSHNERSARAKVG